MLYHEINAFALAIAMVLWFLAGAGTLAGIQKLHTTEHERGKLHLVVSLGYIGLSVALLVAL
jgi:hypothetical protein